MGYVKYFLFLQFVATISVAGSSYVQAPTPPVMETCKSVEDWNGNSVPDPQCTSRNREKQRNYNYAVNTYNQAQNMINSGSTAANKPVEPKYETCVSEDFSCQMRNNKLQNDYNFKLQTYNRVQNEQQAAAQTQTAEQQRMATLNNSTTTGIFSEIEDKNRSAQNKYQQAAQACGALSQAFGLAYAGTCSSGACQGSLLRASIAFSILQAIGGRQAGEHAASGLSACNSGNSVSSSTKDCTPSPVITDPAVVMGNNFDANGNCIGDKKVCDEITGKLPKGVTVKDVQKALADKKNQPFKVNPDGSVTTPDGKTYNASNFSSEEAMRAAGMSAADAKNLAGLLKGNALAGAAADLEKMNAEAKLKETSLNAALSSGGGSTSDSSFNATDGLSKIGNKDDLKNRKPANAGLVKNFNGESIGVAGEDIFIMMNRRYKLKTTQDAFIGQ